MTTGAWLGADEERTSVLTKLPRPGSVLIRSPGPPEVLVERYVDVRPGPSASFDGDGVEMPLRVSCGDESRGFERNELPAVEATVSRFLRGHRTAVVRFGDRSACRRMLPAAAVEAIERRLAAAARGERQTLVTWANSRPAAAGRGFYDAVIV